MGEAAKNKQTLSSHINVKQRFGCKAKHIFQVAARCACVGRAVQNLLFGINVRKPGWKSTMQHIIGKMSLTLCAYSVSRNTEYS